jgi:hypothetical protein
MTLKLHFRNLEYVRPPGSLAQILAHPDPARNETIELALFQEHRYAFFYWNRWTQKLKEKKIGSNVVPCLVTLDWHRDLAWPTEGQKRWLDDLDPCNNRDVALYTWANLTHINDEQIMAAAYLNLIGNIYVHCRQGTFESDWEDRVFLDRWGNKHTVKKFRTYEALEAYMTNSDEQDVYFDIDLDFFVLDSPLSGRGKHFTYLKSNEIKDILNPQRPLISWIFRRLKGFTIATEPEHSGGLLRSNKLLSLVDSIYFKPGLFTNIPGNWNKCTDWKHFERKRKV